MDTELPVPATVNAKVQWSEYHFDTHDYRPNVGDHVQLQAPTQRAHPWTVKIQSMSGDDNTDITLVFPFSPQHPFPVGTPFELVWVYKGHHHVIAQGETTS